MLEEVSFYFIYLKQPLEFKGTQNILSMNTDLLQWTLSSTISYIPMYKMQPCSATRMGFRKVSFKS